MILCPNCRTGICSDNSCLKCGWKSLTSGNIKIFLSDADQADQTFCDYAASYHELSLNDLQQGIVNKSYLEHQAQKLLSYIKGNPSSILEVGVGQGFLLKQLCMKYNKSRIAAVDISVPFLNHVQSLTGVDCFVANAENLPFESEYDLVVASDILEHVINPIDFLLSVNYSLKDEGRMLLRVPFQDNMLQYSKLLGSKYKYAHLRNFSKQNLVSLLEQAGFSARKFYYDGFYAYKRRSVFNYGLIKTIFEYIINTVYKNESDVSSIPNYLGCLLMKPLELVVVADKVRTVKTINI